MEKRIYSLNLAAYIMMVTGEEPKIGNEEDLYYCVFPQNSAVSAAIAEYKLEAELHDYLESYRELRERINSCRKG